MHEVQITISKYYINVYMCVVGVVAMHNEMRMMYICKLRIANIRQIRCAR